MLDGSETDVDCGGPMCKKCGPGQKCTQANDCSTGACMNGTCSSSSCTDMMKNGTETDVDCGGPTCKRCGEGKMCSVPTDCLSDLCNTGLCGTGLAAWWSFNEGMGTVAKDQSGNGNDGTLMNGPKWVAGKSGMALLFMNNFVQVPHASSIAFSGAFTFSFWVTASQFGSFASVLNKSTDQGWTDGYGLYNASGTMGMLCAFESNYNTKKACAQMNTPQLFHHVAVTYDMTNLIIYIDGAPTSQAVSGATLTNTAPLFIGKGQGNLYWLGAVDEVRLYGRALTAAEVGQLVANP
jgi:hypothetical protein